MKNLKKYFWKYWSLSCCRSPFLQCPWRRYRHSGSNVPVSGCMAGPQKNICWSCIFPMRIMGIGAAQKEPHPRDLAAIARTKMGYQNRMAAQLFSASKNCRSSEKPWCSPFLEGTMLQKSQFDIGRVILTSLWLGQKPDSTTYISGIPDHDNVEIADHRWMYSWTYVDASLTYISEVDPMWESDCWRSCWTPKLWYLQTLLPQWVCSRLRGSDSREGQFSCIFFAGCDGNLYPLTGHVYANDDASEQAPLLHNDYLLSYIGKEANENNGGWCNVWENVGILHSRSQYRLSMLFPTPEANGPESVIVLVILFMIGQHWKVEGRNRYR